MYIGGRFLFMLFPSLHNIFLERFDKASTLRSGFTCFFAAAGERSGGCGPRVRAWSTTTQRLGKKVDEWIQQCLNVTA